MEGINLVKPSAYFMQIVPNTSKIIPASSIAHFMMENLQMIAVKHKNNNINQRAGRIYVNEMLMAAVYAFVPALMAAPRNYHRV